MQIKILKAKASDAVILTDIAFTAKRFWKYPESYYVLWQEELSITPDYLRRNIVYRVEFQDRIVGFYSIVKVPEDIYSGEVLIRKGFWMEHIFILPQYHNLGLGTKLVEHARSICKKTDIKRLFIFVDPNTRGFYEKCGAEYCYDSKSSISGRTIPVYKLSFL